MTETQKKMKTNRTIAAEIEKFIWNFDGTQESFLNGNCYWFARILKERFWLFYDVDIAYNQIENHFAMVVAIHYDDETTGRFLFDALGLIDPMVEGDGWEIWSEYCQHEPLDAARVYRDCIWKMPEEEWLKLKPLYREKPWLSA